MSVGEAGRRFTDVPLPAEPERGSVWLNRSAPAALVVVGLHAANTASVVSRSWVAAIAGVLFCAVMTAAAVAAFQESGRLNRALVTGTLGMAAVVACLAFSVPHAVLAGVDRVDVTGIAAGLAGVALIAIALRLLLRGQRRRVQLLAVLALLVLAQWVLVPAVNVGIATNAGRGMVPPAASLGLAGARDVIFPASDGVRLAGWYVSGTNGAAVVLLHGSHGTRVDMRPYLRLLAAQGYAVLAYDARGQGRSGGESNALGWYGGRDLAGAVAFLRRQPGIDPQRIAALGLSMGAEEALRADAEGVPLAAVVADGAGASTSGDLAMEPHGVTWPVSESVSWLTFRGIELVSGEQEPGALRDIAGRIAAAVLLIASGAPNERSIAEQLRGRIGSRAAVWYVPDAGHTMAYTAHPAAYRSHVLGFLARALSGR